MVSLVHKNELYIVGGENKVSGFQYNLVLKLECDGEDPNTCEFKNSPTYLYHARSSHVALPISDKLAYEFCPDGN